MAGDRDGPARGFVVQEVVPGRVRRQLRRHPRRRAPLALPHRGLRAAFVPHRREVSVGVARAHAGHRAQAPERRVRLARAGRRGRGRRRRRRRGDVDPRDAAQARAHRSRTRLRRVGSIRVSRRRDPLTDDARLAVRAPAGAIRANPRRRRRDPEPRRLAHRPARVPQRAGRVEDVRQAGAGGALSGARGDVGGPLDVVRGRRGRRRTGARHHPRVRLRGGCDYGGCRRGCRGGCRGCRDGEAHVRGGRRLLLV